MNRRGGVRVRGGGFTCGRIGSRGIRKPYIRKNETQKYNNTTAAYSTIQQQQSTPSQPIYYRKPTIFQNNNHTPVISHQQQQQQQQQKQNSGLKLVLKRAAGNEYKVKAIDMNRPKREAAQKVKFTFSENEDDDGSSSPSKMTEYRYHHRDINYDDDDEDDDDDEVQYVVQKPSSRRSSQQSSNVNIQQQLKPIVKPPPLPLSVKKSKITTDDVQFLHEAKVISFTSDEIIPETVEKKMLIACNQPKVKINHSKPFPIALVEESTNVVYSKALLLDHLYQSYSSPCILCPLCKIFLSVAEFSKHIHSSDNNNNNNEDEEQEERNKNKSFNILPYRTKNQITEYDMSTWKLFGKRYTEFKKDRLLKRERQRENKKITSKYSSNASRNGSSNKDSSADNNNNGQNKENQDYLKSIKSLNWNYVTKDKNIFIIDKTLLENDQIVNLNADGQPLNQVLSNVVKNNIVNNKKEDLILSEDEDEDETENGDVQMKQEEANHNLEQKNHEIDNEELLSGDEDIDIDDDITEKYEKTIIPSLKSRYYNLYDNLNNELLLYICDNQYTIVPTTYIDYIDQKRGKIHKNGNLNALIENSQIKNV